LSALLEFDGVDAYYGSAHILHDVSLSIGAGERVAALGRNGVGKTTIVNTLLAVAVKRGGEIRIRGERPPRLVAYTAALAGIAVVPQGRKILPSLSIEENLRLGAAPRRKGPWGLERVYRLFPALFERRRASGAALSGGQQQMLAIGRALMANPDLLILDEPSEGLAPVIVDNLAHILGELALTGVAILLIEQHLKLVNEICERFYVISKGAVRDEGRMRDVTREQLQSKIMH
jgi:ABC-type branched-subunit amino acid transport system ATPase component